MHTFMPDPGRDRCTTVRRSDKDILRAHILVDRLVAYTHLEISHHGKKKLARKAIVQLLPALDSPNSRVLITLHTIALSGHGRYTIACSALARSLARSIVAPMLFCTYLGLHLAQRS